MTASPDPVPGPDPFVRAAGKPAADTKSDTPAVRRRTLAFAAQELRLISALVVLLAIGLFLALPFVLSIGAVVFLPLVTAIVLTIILSPLADRLAKLGLPNFLTALLALAAFLGVLALALTAVLRPAMSLFEELPALMDRIASRFQDLQGNFAWLARLNDRVTELAGKPDAEQVVLATPSMLEQVAFATPTVLLEVLLTFLLAFFMIAGRVGLRRRLVDRQHFGANLKAARAMRDVQDRVAAYILTVGLINLGVGILVTAGAWLLGLPYPVMWGGLAALLNFLPYIGPLAMAALLTLYGLGTADSALFGVVPAAAYLGLHTLESNLVTPSILGARFTINPVLILLALSYFSWIWGVVGALLSVPILLTITALIDHLGKPNLLGFIFGEPLFQSNVLDLSEEQ
jgi:predicted PurR-regulated permease PerM